jgi:hypothetical protein
MKLNKVTIKIGLLAPFVMLLWLSSCEDFLEQPTDAITTIDSVFTNPDNAMLALYAAYNNSLKWNHGLREFANSGNQNVTGYFGQGAAGTAFGNSGNAMVCFYSDEASQEDLANNTSQHFVTGNWGPTGGGGQGQREFPAVAVSNAIRTCNIFIDNAAKVPFQTTPKWNWDAAFRDQVIAEARALRAFLHFETFRRYGGIPILDKTATFSNKPGGGLIVTPSAERQSVASVINFVVKECNEIIPLLKQPSEFSNAEIGRIHKGFAYALKAKALLYAASPLYNAAAPPVSYGDAKDSLVCFGNFDANRWQLAATAYQEAITWAEGNGMALLSDPTLGPRDSYALGSISPRTTSPDNNESIYYTQTTQNYLDLRTYRAGSPTLGSTNYGTIASMGFNFIKNNFRDVNGNPLNIPDEGTFVELKNILRHAEPRFHASIWVPGQKFSYLDVSTVFAVTNGAGDTACFLYHNPAGALLTAKSGTFGILKEQCGFFWPKKWFQLGRTADKYITWSEFTLPELYISYAEALNEVNPSNPDIIVYMNKTRERGGLPLLTTADPRFGDKDAMRTEIQKERSVELFMTEHRYFDVRRWKIADNVMGGDWYKIYIYENGTGSYANPVATWTPAQRLANDSKLSYRMIKHSTHVWDSKMHFYPYFQAEVNKGILVQNPGW